MRGMLRVGFCLRGFRCLPWMAVNFFLKDGLNVDPATYQFLQTSASFPMLFKPLYGFVSDAVYIRGQHRIPYILIGVLLQAISWIAMAVLSPSRITTLSILSCLVLGNLGASIADVCNDAMVAEIGEKSESSSSGELQSFVWIASSAGGAIGNLLGGFLIVKYSPQTLFFLFGLVLAVQFLATITVHERSHNLTNSSSSAGIKEQFWQLFVVLRKPEVIFPIAWLATSNAIIPALSGTMFFYQTQQLKIDSTVLGISKVFGQSAMLLWSVVYNRHLKTVPARKLIIAIQVTMAVFMVSDSLFVKGVYRNMGVPDSLYVVVFSGLLEVLYLFKMLPFNVLMSQLCPSGSGCEGSLMALVASALALSFLVSGYLGVALASYVGVAGNDFSGLPRGLMVQAAFALLPICLAHYIPIDEKSKTKKKNE